MDRYVLDQRVQGEKMIKKLFQISQFRSCKRKHTVCKKQQKKQAGRRKKEVLIYTVNAVKRKPSL